MMRFLARIILKLWGWQYDPKLPLERKFLIIGYPHTSNWDFIISILFRSAAGLKSSYIAKHTLFKPPLGWLMTAIGGVPVDRTNAGNFVGQIVDLYNNREYMAIAITPEGTRGKSDYWKSGFYYMAIAAEIPICIGYWDWGQKKVGLSEPIYLTGNVRNDMDTLRDKLSHLRGKFPEKQGPIRLKDENRTIRKQDITG
jgi:1-acyl-sn-glycerol-3-phosphate acyltransferase